MYQLCPIIYPWFPHLLGQKMSENHQQMPWPPFISSSESICPSPDSSNLLKKSFLKAAPPGSWPGKKNWTINGPFFLGGRWTIYSSVFPVFWPIFIVHLHGSWPNFFFGKIHEDELQKWSPWVLGWLDKGCQKLVGLKWLKIFEDSNCEFRGLLGAIIVARSTLFLWCAYGERPLRAVRKYKPDSTSSSLPEKRYERIIRRKHMGE